MMLSPLGADYLRSMAAGQEFSMTYAPPNVKWLFKALVEARVCKIVQRQFDNDAQIYEFITITPYGQQSIRGLQ